MARATKLRVVGGKTSIYVSPRTPRHGLEIGTPCPNCGTALAGAYCYACGQKGEAFHRSVWHLIAEAFEGLTHIDGRVWVTLPRLIARPGKLTRDYLDGHRAAQIPPFRLFLVVLIVVFFTGSLDPGAQRNIVRIDPRDSSATQNPSDRTDFKKALDAMWSTPQGKWLAERRAVAVKNPEALTRSMEGWAHQFAILMLPIAALLLSALFVLKKDVYVFDHLIFSMHSLAFQGLLLSAVFLGSLAFGDTANGLLLLSPVHLFAHMRGTYRISVLGTLVRMSLLFVGSMVAFVVLMVGLVFAGLATVH